MRKSQGFPEGKYLARAAASMSIWRRPARLKDGECASQQKRKRMQHLLLIYENEAETAKRGEAGMKEDDRLPHLHPVDHPGRTVHLPAPERENCVGLHGPRHASRSRWRR
jgi:hypothetical protein